MSKRITPNHREIIAAVDSVTGNQVYPTATNNKLDVNATASLAGTALPISGATTAVGVAIVDSSGNQISSFGGGTQYTDGGVPPAHPIGGTIEWSDGSNWQTVSTAKPLPIAIVSGGGSGGTSSSFGSTFPATGTAMGATDGTNMQSLKVDASKNLLTSINVALPAGTNVIGHVISDSGSTTAVTQATAANLNATVVGTGSAGSAATGVLTVQGIASMTKLLVTPDANSAINVAQINSVTPLMGNGVTGTGSQRVTIASDNTAFSVNATLSAETTKVIGVTRTADGSGNLLTSTGNALDTNLKTSSITLATSEATLDAALIAQEAATSGVKGLTAFGAVTTNAPTYSTTKSDALSLDTSGLLRVSLKDTPANTNKLLVTPDSVALPANQSVNVSQINAVTPLMGNGVTGTGSQRVTIASDNTAFSVNATLSAETTKVIGVTRTADGSGNLLTSTTNALDVNLKSGGITTVTATQGTAAALASGWPVVNGELTDVTGTFTNATQTTSVTASGLDGYGNILISINGTYGTATAVFEGSDDSGTTWYGISEADRTDSNVIESGYTSLSNVTRAWQINNPGFDSIRVRSTAVASGTVNVRMSPSAAPSSAGLSVSVGTALPTGTNAIGTVNLSPTAVGGWAGYALGGTNAALTTTQTVSAAAGKVGGYQFINLNSSPAYVQVFDTTGAVTLGSTQPTYIFAIPANSTAANGVGANWEMSNGLIIANGIKIAATTTTNGASTVATGVAGTFIYK